MTLVPPVQVEKVFGELDFDHRGFVLTEEVLVWLALDDPVVGGLASANPYATLALAVDHPPTAHHDSVLAGVHRDGDAPLAAQKLSLFEQVCEKHGHVAPDGLIAIHLNDEVIADIYNHLDPLAPFYGEITFVLEKSRLALQLGLCAADDVWDAAAGAPSSPGQSDQLAGTTGTALTNSSAMSPKRSLGLKHASAAMTRLRRLQERRAYATSVEANLFRQAVSEVEIVERMFNQMMLHVSDFAQVVDVLVGSNLWPERGRFLYPEDVKRAARRVLDGWERLARAEMGDGRKEEVVDKVFGECDNTGLGFVLGEELCDWLVDLSLEVEEDRRFGGSEARVEAQAAEALRQKTEQDEMRTRSGYGAASLEVVVGGAASEARMAGAGIRRGLAAEDEGLTIQAAKERAAKQREEKVWEQRAREQEEQNQREEREEEERIRWEEQRAREQEEMNKYQARLAAEAEAENIRSEEKRKQEEEKRKQEQDRHDQRMAEYADYNTADQQQQQAEGEELARQQQAEFGSLESQWAVKREEDKKDSEEVWARLDAEAAEHDKVYESVPQAPELPQETVPGTVQPVPGILGKALAHPFERLVTFLQTPASFPVLKDESKDAVILNHEFFDNVFWHVFGEDLCSML